MELTSILWCFSVIVLTSLVSKYFRLFGFIKSKLQYVVLQLFIDVWETPVAISAKSRLFESLLNLRKPRILEIGAGDGRNLPFFPKGSRYVVVDPNETYHEPLRKRPEILGSHLTLEAIFPDYAQNLVHIEDNSIDAYVMTLVACTIDDLTAVFNEAHRVLKQQGGRMYIMHHNRGRWQHDTSPRVLLEKILIWPADKIMDCNPNKDIEPDVRRVFPKMTTDQVDLPMKWRTMQPHHFIEAVKG